MLPQFPIKQDYFYHCRRKTWTNVCFFLPCICILLIFFWSQISEVSDYVSIKHIYCPAINALIAGETENVLGCFNNGVLFIRVYSDMKPYPAIHPCCSLTTYWNTWTVHISVKFYLENNTNIGNKNHKEVCHWKDRPWSKCLCSSSWNIFSFLLGIARAYTYAKNMHLDWQIHKNIISLCRYGVLLSSPYSQLPLFPSKNHKNISNNNQSLTNLSK